MSVAFNLADAMVSIVGNTKPLNDALEQAHRQTQKSIGAISEKIGTIGTAMTAAGVGIVGGLGMMVKKFAETGDDLDEMSQRTGFSATALSELGYAAKLSGTSIDGIEVGIKKMQKAIESAGTATDQHTGKTKDNSAEIAKLQVRLQELGVKYQLAAGAGKVNYSTLVGLDSQMKQAQISLAKLTKEEAQGTDETKQKITALSQLGLKYSDLKGLKPEEQFNKITTALAGVEDKTKQAAIAQQVFGRSGTALLPMLADGAAGLQKMKDEAHRLGIVWSDEDAKAAGDFNDSLDALKMSFGSIVIAVGKTLVPALKGLVPAIREDVIAMAGWIGQHPNLVMWIGKIGVALAIGGPVLLGLSRLVQMMTFAANLAKALGAANGLAAVAGGIGKIGAAAGVSNVSFAAFAATVGALALAIGGVVAVIQSLINLKDGGTNFIQQWIDKWDWLGKKIDWVFDKMQAVYDWVSGSHGQAVLGVGSSGKMAPAPDTWSNQYQAGGYVNRGGMALVGERGPEIVSLPRGSFVHNADETRGMMGGSLSVTINVSGARSLDGATAREFAGLLARELRQYA